MTETMVAAAGDDGDPLRIALARRAAGAPSRDGAEWAQGLGWLTSSDAGERVAGRIVVFEALLPVLLTTCDRYAHRGAAAVVLRAALRGLDQALGSWDGTAPFQLPAVAVWSMRHAIGADLAT